MAILSECIRYKKMSDHQKKRDEYCKGKCKSRKLWWNIEPHLDMNIYYKNLSWGAAKVLLLIINILKNDIYELYKIIFIISLNNLFVDFLKYNLPEALL